MIDRDPSHGVWRIDVRVTPPYAVHVAAGTLDTVADVIAESVGRPSRAFVLSDDTVAPLYGSRVLEGLGSLGCPTCLHVVPSGESSKSLEGYAAVLGAMADARLDRGSVVIALGGGVVGDLAGFAAATYVRGLPYLQVPTTVLSMVDSSVGGKTGINLEHGKNLVGAFWQPVAVLVDVETLASLPVSARRQGGVELFKAGLLGDPEIVRAFATGTAFGSVIDEGGPGLADLIARGIAVKAAIVAADPLEHGVRATLNLGHTVGHAIESLSRQTMPHGEAVAYGLYAAAEIGARRGLTDWRAHAGRLLRWVAPGALPSVSEPELLERMARDKKQVGDRRRFVLLETIGRAVVVDDVSDAEITRAWRALQEVAR